MEKIENLHGQEYDKVKKVVSNGELVVAGEITVKERAEGLGGEFTYCTLGDPIEMDKILTGETLPPFTDLATVLFHTATNLPGDPAVVNAETFYMGKSTVRCCGSSTNRNWTGSRRLKLRCRFLSRAKLLKINPRRGI